MRGVVGRIPQHPEQRCRSGSVAGAGHRAGQHVSFDAALSLRGVVVGFAGCHPPQCASLLRTGAQPVSSPNTTTRKTPQSRPEPTLKGPASSLGHPLQSE